MKQGQWKVITILIAFMMAISFSTSIFVYAETPEEQKKKKEQQQQEQQKQQQQQQQQQKLQQEQLKKQQEQQKQQQQQKLQQEQLKKQQEQQRQQQRPTGPTPGGPGPGTQPQTGQPPVQKQPSPSGMKPGQTGVSGGPVSGTQPQTGQPPVQKQPSPSGMKPGQTGVSGGPVSGTQPQAGQPSVQKQPSQPRMQPNQPGVHGGQQPSRHLQRPTGQPGTGPKQGQPAAKTGTPGQGPNQTNMNVRQRTTINIKQPPQERQRVLTERHKEIRPEHNARAAVHFQSERVRFKPVSRVVVRHSPEIQRRVFEKHHFHPETYHARRAVFYETYRFHTPVWAFSLQPRFGLWDTPALAFIVAHAADEQYALWYYSHRFDPDVIAWRQEMNGLAAANAELAEQLAVMDAKTRELQARGVQVDNSYVPTEMEDIALAAEVAVPTQDQNNQAPPPVQPQQYQQDQQPQQPAPRQSNNDAVQQKLDLLQEEIDRLRQQQQYQEPQGPAESYP
jgi:hypothetical protein